MRLFSRKKERNPLDLFLVVHDKCIFCEHGPVIKYEPEQFKLQCWTCKRVMDKLDYMVRPEGRKVFLIETLWIDQKIEEANG